MKTIYILTLALILSIYPQRTEAQQQSWQRVTTIDSLQANWIYQLAHTPLGLVVGSQSAYRGRDSLNRMFVSPDFGRTWREGYNQNDNSTKLFSFHSLFLSPIFVANRLFCLGFPGELKNSTDSGKTWQTVGIKIVDFSTGLPFDNITSVGNILFAVKSRPLISQDTGKTFTVLNSLENSMAISVRGLIFQNNILWAIASNALYSSLDTGKTWRKVSDQQEAVRGSVTPITKSLLVAQYYRDSLTQKIHSRHISYDGGISWQRWNFLDAKESVGSSVIFGSYIYLNSSAGLFYSTDQGRIWVKESGKNGLPEGIISGITISGNNLFVAVFGRGLFSLDLTTVSTPEEPQSTLLLTFPAPNPSTDHTDLTFTLPRAASVNVTLYSTLGTEVWRSQSDILPAGEQHIRIDTRHLPTGVYAYRLTAGGVSSVGRVVVVR